MLAVGLVLAGAIVGVVGAPNPTEPSSASVFNVGKDCTIKWDADSTGAWKAMNIQLMTGDNWNMVHITTVAQNIDATDATKNTYTYTCPDVTPNSAIYFYQFSDPSDPKNLLWTTRWTLASADGQTTTPTETTQPNGDKIPWGKGALVDPSTAVPPPAYLSGAQSNSTTSSVAASSAAAASSAPVTTGVFITQNPSSAPAVSTTPAVTSIVIQTSTTARTAAATTRSTSSAPSSSANATSAQTTANGAQTTVVSGFAMIGAFVAALGLF